MSDETGAVVALIALASTGIAKKFLSDEPLLDNPWDVLTGAGAREEEYTFDAGVDHTIYVGAQEFKSKLECRTWAHKNGIPIPEQCR